MIVLMNISKVREYGIIHNKYAFIGKTQDSCTRLKRRIMAMPEIMMNRDHLLLNTLFFRMDWSGSITLICCLDLPITVFMNMNRSVIYTCMMGKIRIVRYDLSSQFVTALVRLYCMGI